jgi:glyoxylase-like metal-dependent hydrolase (beta-lactamase superfamily II)
VKLMTERSRRDVLTGVAAAALLAPFAMRAPAQAAAPFANKQVPGYYRSKVGSFEVTAVTDGAREAAPANNFVRNMQRPEVDEAFTAAGYNKASPRTSFTPIVVNTGQKLIVIDTGLGPAAFEQSKGAAGQFQTNLQAAGIDRNAVDVVIISHFHGDHITGLLGADGKPLYPNAEVMVPESEYKFWMDDGNLARAPDAAKGGFNNARRIMGALGGTLTQYGSDKELVPGIRSMPTPGHTPGHHSHIISSGSATLLVQADVTAGPALLFVRNPGWHGAFDADGPMAEATRRKVYDQAAADRMLVQGYHFPFPSAAHIEKDGAGYRFMPAMWNPSI